MATPPKRPVTTLEGGPDFEGSVGARIAELQTSGRSLKAQRDDLAARVTELEFVLREALVALSLLEAVDR